jgi:hypothetical protein
MPQGNKKDTTDPRELGEQLKKILLEKRIIKTIKSYYDKVGTFDPASGVTLIEYKNYLHDHGYSELRTQFLTDIQAKIDTRMLELDKMSRRKTITKKEQEEKEKREYLKARMKIYENASQVQTDTAQDGSEGIQHLKQIMLIPSWRKLLDIDTFKGFYLNQPVYEVIHDNVLLLPDFAVTGFEETMGEPFIFLTGPGIYYTQFRLSPGELITDYREITGIVLPMDLYDRAQGAASLVSTDDLLMTELMTTIPFGLFQVEQTKQMYIRGVVARNVFHPYKECFTQLVKMCQSPDSLKREEGLKILSGGLNQEIPMYTNEILTEQELPADYSRLTAGLKNIQPKLEKIIIDLQIDGLKQAIFDKISLMKKEFLEVGYPKLQDWMP